MAKRFPRGPEAFNRWRASEEKTVAAVSEAVGDRGGQLAKWASGSRKRIPLRLVAKVASYTGLPFDQIADRDQVELARDLFAVMARDSAREGRGAAA